MITPRTGWDRVGKSQIEPSGPKTPGARAQEKEGLYATQQFSGS